MTGARSSARRAFVWLLLGLSAPSGLAAQADPQVPAPNSRIVGRVLDAETGRPIVGAVLSIEALSRTTLSDASGAFIFSVLRPGVHELEVRHIAYGVRTTPVETRAGTTLTLLLRVEPEAVTLEPLDVRIEWRPRELEDVGFYDRRALGVGAFFDPPFVKRWGVGAWSTAGSLIHDVIAEMYAPLQGVSLCEDLDEVPVFVDGRRDRANLASGLSSSEIGAIEVYDHAYGAPDFLVRSTVELICGAVVIWTKKWLDPDELERQRIVLCEPAEGDASRSVVEGTVRDSLTGVPLPRAAVEAWQGTAKQHGTSWTTTADDVGRYRFCGLPPEALVTVQARFADQAGPPRQPRIRPSTSRVGDLTVMISKPGRVLGRVVDRDSGRPLATAEVRLEGTGQRSLTDRQGFFRFPRVDPGDYRITVRHIGYGLASDSVFVVSDRTTEVRTELSTDPIALEPLVITVLLDRRLETRGFYERRRWGERVGAGRFFTREDIQRRSPSRVSRLVEDVPGFRVRCSGARTCRIVPSRMRRCRHVPVYVNGVLVISDEGFAARGGSLDDLVSPGDLVAAEVYPGAASLPAEFSGSSGQCGAIVLWTG